MRLGERKGLAQVHTVSQNQAGARTEDSRLGGALPAGRAHTAGFLLSSAQLACVDSSSHRLSAHQPMVKPLTPGAASGSRGPIGRPLGAYTPFPAGPGPVIAVTAPRGRGAWASSTRVRFPGQKPQAEPHRTASTSSPLPTNHFLPLSWHQQPEARGSCTASVSAAPPVPARCKPSQPPTLRRGQESTCPGGGAVGWVTEAVGSPTGIS